MEYMWRDVSVGQFSELLLQIGDGNYPESEGKIIIPSGLRMVGVLLKYLFAEIYCRQMSKKNLGIGCAREPF